MVSVGDGALPVKDNMASLASPLSLRPNRFLRMHAARDLTCTHRLACCKREGQCDGTLRSAFRAVGRAILQGIVGESGVQTDTNGFALKTFDPAGTILSRRAS